MGKLSRIYRPTEGAPLLSERLLTLAQDASRAGFPVVSEHLLYLAEAVLDPPDDPTPPAPEQD